ncbi:glycosyltransferase family 2 protein [Afifella pfennigii]|uniref:glycosyltransferase family 2 protein n=1 Tax=Afifella pfennigii TaxID=209897 RepID=UPI00054FA301|nr:glycosyltransferase family 2 protein [Afifella pfennigii]
MTVPISIFIITRNEADRIGATLAAVRGLSDDIVVVDSGSTDGTQALAERLGARLVHHDWIGFGPQKRFAEEACRHDWVLNLDADEVPQPELVGAISALFEEGEPPLSFYRLNIVTVYPGQSQPRFWADFVTPVRLYDKRVGRYSSSLTDDRVVDGGAPSALLEGAVWHFSFRSFDHIGRKLAGYSQLQTVEKAGRRSPLLLRLRLGVEYPLQFAKFFIGRRHWTGGLVGLRYAHEVARAKRQRIGTMMQARLGKPAQTVEDR